jgi:glycosyltransferase involved in cell wall biosynthesis
MAQIDVLLPIKSPAPWLGATLESLNTQTYTDWQLVASIHGEDPVARETVLAHVPAAQIVTAPGNGNLASTLNAGLRATTSPYIARIDQDDVALPQRFQFQIDFLTMNPAVAAVGSGATLIGVHDEVLGYRQQLEDPQRILRRLRWKSPLMHPSVMFLRKPVISIGGYSEVATNVEDYDLWLRLATLGALGGINRPLIQYRIHPHQITSHKSIPPTAMKHIGKCRRELAKYLGESQSAAYARHTIWATKQRLRRLLRDRRV